MMHLFFDHDASIFDEEVFGRTTYAFGKPYWPKLYNENNNWEPSMYLFDDDKNIDDEEVPVCGDLPMSQTIHIWSQT